MKNCLQCGKEYDKKGIYCDKKCADKAYRERKKIGNSNIREDDKSSVASLIRIEGAESHKWCNYCGLGLKGDSDYPGFCNEIHAEEYSLTVQKGSTLSIIIDSRTKILTKKYDKIQEIIDLRKPKEKVYYKI